MSNSPESYHQSRIRTIKESIEEQKRILKDIQYDIEYYTRINNKCVLQIQEAEKELDDLTQAG